MPLIFAARLRSAMARRRSDIVTSRLLSTKALCTNEWRVALAARMKGATKGLTVVNPYTESVKLNNDLGTLILSASAPLSSARPGNGGMRLWSYADKAAAEVEAQVGPHTSTLQSSMHSRCPALPQGLRLFRAFCALAGSRRGHGNQARHVQHGLRRCQARMCLVNTRERLDHKGQGALDGLGGGAALEEGWRNVRTAP